MIELNPAENILKRVYIRAVADALNVKKNPIHEKVICRGYGNTYKAPEETKIGRNSQCPCGSNKKYKNCCMKGGADATH